MLFKIPTYQILIIAFLGIVIFSLVLSKLNFSINLGKTPEDYEIEGDEIQMEQMSQFVNTQQGNRALEEQIGTNIKNYPIPSDHEFVNSHVINEASAEKKLKEWTTQGGLGGNSPQGFDTNTNTNSNNTNSNNTNNGAGSGMQIENFGTGTGEVKRVNMVEPGIKNEGSTNPNNPMMTPMSQPNFPSEHNDLSHHFQINNGNMNVSLGNGTSVGAISSTQGGNRGAAMPATVPYPAPSSGSSLGGVFLGNGDPNLENQFKGREKSHNIGTDYNWGYQKESTMNGGSLGVNNTMNGLSGFAPTDSSLSPFTPGGSVDQYSHYVMGRSDQTSGNGSCGITCPPRMDNKPDDIRMGMGNPNIGIRHTE